MTNVLTTKTFLSVLGLFIVVAFFVFLPSINGPFVFDDRYQFWAAPRLPEGPPSGYILGVRPVLQASYYLNHIWGGPEPRSFHLVNILLHAINATLVGVVLYLLLKLAYPGGAKNGLASVLGAALFLLHPLQSEPVCYLSARSDLLCSSFFLLALAIYLTVRPVRMTWISAISIMTLFGLAMGSKEIAIVLPAVLLVIEWLFRDRMPSLVKSGAWRLYGPLAIVGAGGLAFILRYLRADPTLSVSPSATYFYTQWRALARYLQLLVWPFGLNIDHEFPLSQSPTDHGALWWLLLLLIVAGLLIRRRDKQGLVLTGLAIVILVLAPTSSFMPVTDPISERRMYLPMLGVAVLVVAGVMEWKGKQGSLLGLMTGVLAVFSVVSYQRAEIWSDPVLLWKDTAQKSPKKFRPQFWLGQSYLTKGNCQAAGVELEKAEQLRPQPDAELQTFRAFAYACSNQPEQAAAAITRAMQIKGEDAQNLALRGNYLASAGKIDPALADLNRALQLNANSVPALSTRAKVYLLQKRPAEAVVDLEKAAQLAPYETQLVVLLAQARSLLASQQSRSNR